jgi:phytoene dehydrogenase-like protein
MCNILDMIHPEYGETPDGGWDVVVVGGGLAGLTAAATAATHGASVLLLDGRAFGGRAVTDQVGRFRLNRGAHALYRSGPARPVMAELGVAIAASPPGGGDAHGRIADRIGVLPWGADALARTDLIEANEKQDLMDLLADVAGIRREEVASLSAEAWLDALGLPATVRRYLETQIRLVTYVTDMASVSADLVVAQLQQDPLVDYLDGGWQQLVDRLVTTAEERGAVLRRGRVEELVLDEDRVQVVVDGASTMASQVVLAVGTPGASARLLPEPPEAWADLGPPLEAAALDVGVRSVPPRRVLLGIDRPLYLSVHAPPAELAPPGGAVAHLLRYLRPGEVLSAADARVEMTEHAALAGIQETEVEESRYLHRMLVTAALPTPDRGGMAGRPRIDETGTSGVLVAGDWVGPDGHLADTSIASGHAAGRLAAANATDSRSSARR